MHILRNSILHIFTYASSIVKIFTQYTNEKVNLENYLKRQIILW